MPPPQTRTTRVFGNRIDPHYARAIGDALEIDGPTGLLATAIPLRKSLVVDGITYTRSIEIDYFGISASTLFDRGHAVSANCQFERLSKLSSQIQELNANGTAVRIRIGCLYPYAPAGLERIQAEMNHYRPSMTEPEIHQPVENLYQLDQDGFDGSSLVAATRATIISYTEWRDNLRGEQSPLLLSPNKLRFRFFVVNPLVCGLRVNRRFFYDAYTYAKRSRHETRCVTDVAPVIETSPGSDLRNSTYTLFCDHFRYLWEQDLTLYDTDAIEPGRGGRPPRMRPPEDVDYANKAVARKSRDWGKAASERLRRHCPRVAVTRTEEIAFIACGWERGHQSDPRPHRDARTIADLLTQFFGPMREVPGAPLIIPKIVVGVPGDALSKELYRSLDEASLGIILLSPELQAKREGREVSLAPANVYLELGYLLSRLGPHRTFIFSGSTPASGGPGLSAQVPSNIGDLVHIPYTVGEVALHLPKLVLSLLRRQVRIIDQDFFEQFALRFTLWLRAQYTSRDLTAEQVERGLDILRQAQAQARLMG